MAPALAITSAELTGLEAAIAVMNAPAVMNEEHLLKAITNDMVELFLGHI